ncbi:MAG: Asp-tRNA(Asn)/Glu-tRNA(Gln) amidotransferase GatCAB subunit C [Flavobacteriia bacterium]|nr:Asp-tRNA(Asn)/Glu-tRNA(Gln) amidotransferase GatCAB subunit C [Flavobacteriia bacterium]NDD47720.1 Asp-tRNA(Asn)/Glu-tRNA(Gln) amidotransferase GatCAB subunit C [Flavobacteriia bacterium]NDD50930.1 Asp-tRNA(Asn)/Glu-tRNA(Gln) amidotransferase GatCAB subunit C [Flavobacteriia bacterium]NDH91438.1 Asp-tRNA(Asn)/Glu-tRNA(Gln) amidotransferase GatCAB subunit C [Flavobacteriia bacterium]
MKISTEDVQKLAHLSRLQLNDSEAEAMKQDLTKILDFVAAIEAMDLEGIEPLVYMTDRENVLREDEPEAVMTHAQAMKNAPDADSDYFRVPRVVEK